MLITELKPKTEFARKLKGKILIIECHGCREVHYPTKQVEELIEELENSAEANEANEVNIVDRIALDYLCNHEFAKIRTEKYKNKIDSSDIVLIFSCGVGVQVFSSYINKPVYPGCNTIHIDGYQGLNSTPGACDLCGDCLLYLTGGMCPITACSKGLLNGPCGGAKNGKCEVTKEMDCGWEKIYNKLKSLNRIEKVIDKGIKLRDYKKKIPEIKK
ncbi:MAG: hypothetical protein DDT19_02390 [Syntrophomonadaceae bacterium]|nr:hypothetical protein [Bacillota bacterium]